MSLFCKSVCCLFLVVLLGSPSIAEDNPNSKWTQSSPFPAVAVAKYNEGPNGPEIMILAPQMIVTRGTLQYPIVTEFVQISKEKIVPRKSLKEVPSEAKIIEQMDVREIADLKKNYGQMTKLTTPLKYLVVQKLDGTEIPHDRVPNVLKDATHVFYGEIPDEFYRVFLKDDILVILPKKGTILAKVQSKFDIEP